MRRRSRRPLNWWDVARFIPTVFYLTFVFNGFSEIIEPGLYAVIISWIVISIIQGACGQWPKSDEEIRREHVEKVYKESTEFWQQTRDQIDRELRRRADQRIIDSAEEQAAREKSERLRLEGEEIVRKLHEHDDET